MSDMTISGVLRDPVHVPAGERWRVLSGAVVQGQVSVEGTLIVEKGGAVQGALSVDAGGEAFVRGAVQGAATVDPDAELTVEAGGSLQGALVNYGDVVVRGMFAGTVVGEPFTLEGAGRVIEPEIRNGEHIYRM